MKYNTPKLEVILFEADIDTIIASIQYEQKQEPTTGTPDDWG